MKKLKILYKSLLIVFIVMNAIAGFHAYHFTHVTEQPQPKTNGIKQLSALEKVKVIALGVSHPKPKAQYFPQQPYQTVQLPTERKTLAWFIPVSHAKGCVALFHGYGGEKSSMLPKSQYFNQLGYSTLLVDAWGAGESEGQQITIGYKESQQVTAALTWMQDQGFSEQFLMGSSMGAAFILKAVNDADLSPSGIIIECPFSSLKTTVDARFKMMGIPAFPLSNLLVFWGGIENGFNAFGYEPVEYAKAVQCPTLLFYGAQDPKVSLAETEAIYKNLNGLKEKVIFEKAAHGNYWLHYEELWKNKTRFFLKNFNSTFPEQIPL